MCWLLVCLLIVTMSGHSTPFSGQSGLSGLAITGSIPGREVFGLLTGYP